MPRISNYVNQSLGPRRSAYITTVDPKTRKIEAQLKDGGLIQIALFDIPSFFVWPKTGEHWIIRQDAGYWRLFNKFDSNDNQAVGTLKPGEAKIAAETIKTPSGRSVVTVSDSQYLWTSLELLNNWRDVSDFSEDEIIDLNVSSDTQINANYLTDLPKASYRHNELNKSIEFRGIIYNPSFISEFSLIQNYAASNFLLSNAGLIGISAQGNLFVTQSNSSETSISLFGVSIQTDSST